LTTGFVKIAKEILPCVCHRTVCQSDEDQNGVIGSGNKTDFDEIILFAELAMFSTPISNSPNRLIFSTLATVAFLASSTSLIVLWTPDQAGFPETVLSMHTAN
jgi:hypothetical protein